MLLVALMCNKLVCLRDIERMRPLESVPSLPTLY